MRTIVVGDIHGCLEEFDELVKLVEYRRQGVYDRLVLLGDLVDRGPDPAGVLRRAQELRAVSVLGNHEEKHLRWRRHEKKKQHEIGYKNPMRPFHDQRLKEHLSFSESDWEYMERMSHTLLLGEFGPGRPYASPNPYRAATWVVVHAGFEPCRAWNDQEHNVCLRVRHVNGAGEFEARGDQDTTAAYWAEKWPGPERVVYGHHVHQLVIPTLHGPDGMARAAGIDTGCVFGGKLTAAIFDDKSENPLPEFAAVPAKQAYAEWHKRMEE